MNEARKEKWGAVLPFVILALGAGLTFLLSRNGYEATVMPETASATSPAAVTDDPAAATEPASGPFYLVGAVRRPGIYPVTPDTYVYELVERAGGFTEIADRHAVNLAARVQPGGMLEIPERRAASPSQAPDEDPTRATEVYGLLPREEAPTDGLPKIRVNRADADDWASLPGIGPVTAEAILATRERLGGFRRPEDLMEVPGIKERRLEQLRPHLIFDEVPGDDTPGSPG